MIRLTAGALVCFDNDGTLFVSHEVANPAIQRQYVRFCRAHGLLDEAEPSDEVICRLTGQPGPAFYRALLPPSLQDLAPQFREFCLEGEVEEVLARGRLYPGVEELLRDLRGVGLKLALVTNAGEKYLGAVRQRVGYEALLDGIYHFGMRGLTTKSQMIRMAMLELAAETAVMVGDRSSDLEGAQGAGVPFVGCLYGYGPPAELAGADLVARNVGELRTILLPPSPGPVG